VATSRAQEIRTGLAWLHSADPVLARVIADRPDFDPDVWVRRLPAMGLFGALVYPPPPPPRRGEQILTLRSSCPPTRWSGSPRPPSAAATRDRMPNSSRKTAEAIRVPLADGTLVKLPAAPDPARRC
jgi:hypothetical protein